MASLSAGTSSGSEYQVFLSFRGPDTRKGFTDFLYHNLIDAGICVFRDDEELRVGERIGGSLLQAIDNSSIYIPIFSRTYASSQWCLQELAQIVANTSKSEGNKEILPVFFDVEPDDVKLKTSLYLDAILNLEREKKLSNEKVDAWREALMEVSVIKGWEAKKHIGYGELIKLIVEEVLKKLKTKQRLVTEYLVGIDDRVEAISELVDASFDDVRLIQIHGMGGVGKTTLAKVVFNKFSSHFGKYSCFLEDVREKSLRTDGSVELQKKLLSDMGIHSGTRSIDEIDYGMMRTRDALCNKKVLIVLDDIDNSEQVEKLIGNSCLNSGSRILITTRNKDVLRINRLKYHILDYEMEMMSTDHALELFSRHAFNRDSPSYDYNDLSREIVSATGRLPLALEVIGSLLYHKRQEIWEETLVGLRKAPHKDVFGKLKISYDALSVEQQQIFLDIACFFIGEDKTNAIYMWSDCGLFPHNDVDVLSSMSLIKIVEKNKFWMHDQVKNLGREIVHQENPMNLERHSRLWSQENILQRIATEEVENVQALDLDLRKHHWDVVIRGEELGRFKNLKYLKLNGGNFVGDLENRLTELRWIIWNNPSPKSIPINMHLKNVVILEFSSNDFIDYSKLQSLIKMARKLKVLSLRRCNNIIIAPDFSGCPNLERLTFERCFELRKIDTSIGKLNCLIELKIDYCINLEDLPKEIENLVNLKYFSAQRNMVKKLPDSLWKLKSLCEVHFSHFASLHQIPCHNDFFDLANSWELPSAIGMLQNLEVLIVNCCYLKGQLPSGIRNLTFLRILNLSNTHIREVPETISLLPRLQRLELLECHHVQELPALPTSLTHLQVSSASLLIVPDLSELINLVELSLNDCGGDKLCDGELSWIGRLSKLTKLCVGLHNVPAPAELASLPLLNHLDFLGLDLQTIPQLPLSLQTLCLDDFDSTVSLSPNLRNLSCLYLRMPTNKEFQLDGHQLPNIRELCVVSGGSLERLSLSSMTKLKDVKVNDCPKLFEIQFARFESLETLEIQCCESFGRLVYVGEAGHDDIESDNESVDELTSLEERLFRPVTARLTLPATALNKLRSFTLVGCLKILEIEIIGSSESWEYFKVNDCPCMQSLGGLSNLKNLKSLIIRDCTGLHIVKGLEELRVLGCLTVKGCGWLERLNVSSFNLPNDCYICVDVGGEPFRGSLGAYKLRNERMEKLVRLKLFTTFLLILLKSWRYASGES